MESLMRERTQMEEEMRDIYDKRESVAQWEAQISEIIKWYAEWMWSTFVCVLLHF